MVEEEKSVADFSLFVRPLIRQFLVAKGGNSVADFVRGNKTETYFRAQIYSSFFLGYFYYKFRPCISVNLEIERAENKGLETTQQTRVLERFL